MHNLHDMGRPHEGMVETQKCHGVTWKVLNEILIYS